MSHHKGGFSGEARDILEELKLNGRSGEAFNAVKPRRVKKHAPGIRVSEPCDINAEFFAVRSLGVQRNRFETAVCSRNGVAKSLSRGGIIRRKEFFRGLHMGGGSIPGPGRFSKQGSRGIASAGA